MKTIFLSLLVLAVMQANSQPIADGPAKTYIRQYNSYIEKAKAPDQKPGMVRTYLHNAEGTLRSIAKYDPSFNIKPLEEELKQLMAANELAINKAKEVKLVASMQELLEQMEKTDEGSRLGLFPQRIASVESNLTELKKLNTGYNTQAIEERLNKCKSLLGKSETVRTEKIRAVSATYDKNGDGLAGLFTGNTTTEMRGTGDQEKDIAAHKEQLRLYNEKVEALLAKGPVNDDHMSNYIRNTSEAAADRIARTEKSIMESRHNSALFALRELIGEETYWKAASRVFPGVPEAARVYQLAQAALQRVGGEEQVKARVNANHTAYIRSVKFPPAVQQNASLEQSFRKVFAANFPGVTILKVNIITEDWTTVRHDISGILLARKQAAAIGTKEKDGVCRFYIYQIKQDHIGNSFGSFNEYSRGDRGEIFCDNIK